MNLDSSFETSGERTESIMLVQIHREKNQKLNEIMAWHGMGQWVDIRLGMGRNWKLHVKVIIPGLDKELTN